jgi:hypothetical protein
VGFANANHKPLDPSVIKQGIEGAPWLFMGNMEAGSAVLIVMMRLIRQARSHRLILKALPVPRLRRIMTALGEALSF